MQLLLQIYTDSFETSLVFWSWSEDMHVVWIQSSDYFYHIKPQLNVYHFFQHFSPSVLSISYQCLYICSTFECKCPYSFIQFFMKHLYVLMSWPEDMDMLLIKFLSFVSVFCSANLSCSMIVYIFRRTQSGGGHKFSELASCN